MTDDQPREHRPSIIWPQPDEPARDVLIALLKRAELPAISTYEDIADAILAAGWVDLERFRHDVTMREESRREEIARLTDQLRSAINEIERLAGENEQLENRAATCTVEHGTPMPKHAPFELQGGDLHGFRFCQACRKTWPCGEQARKGDPEAHIQHGGAL